MRYFRCTVEDCKYHTEDDECESDWVTISDEDMTSAGFYPMCQEYEEKEWGGEC